MSVIIYPPTIDWTWMKQRPQQLLSQLSEKGYQVYYCNYTQKDLPVEKISPHLYLVHNHQRWVQEELPRIRQGSEIGVWCSLPKQAKSLSVYRADWIIYDCIDEFSEWMFYEKEMAELATGIVCSSERLYKRMKQIAPNKKVILVRNGYDPAMNLHQSVDLPIPVDFPQDTNIHWIGYVGAWAPWVDEQLVKRLTQLPGIKVMVIGPEFGRKMNLKDLPDLVYLGMKPHQILPNYIKRFSICIIPFRITSLTLATNPVKAYEYLASGTPTISTDLPEACLMKPYVDAANGLENFIELVKHRLVNPGDRKARIQFALNNTWKARSDQVERLLKEIRRISD